jgi:hypothetical protein
VPWSEGEVEAYLRRELRAPDGRYPVPFEPQVLDRIATALRAGLYRLNRVPTDDPFWRGTNGAPTLFKLGLYCRQVMARDPADDDARWTLIAIDWHYGDSDFGRRALFPLIARETGHLRWLVSGARHVQLSCGCDTCAPLQETVLLLQARVPNFDAQVRAFARANDPMLRRTAQIALAALDNDGQRLSALWRELVSGM